MTSQVPAEQIEPPQQINWLEFGQENIYFHLDFVFGTGLLEQSTWSDHKQPSCQLPPQRQVVFTGWYCKELLFAADFSIVTSLGTKGEKHAGANLA